MFSASKTGATGGYQIPNSLRFRSSASAYLNRTPSVAGNRTTWTWSGWVKRGTINASANMQLFAASGSTYDNAIQYTGGGTNDVLRVQFDGNNAGYVPTSGFYRDPSAWYHIVVAVDTTQATASNRVKMYVNGIEVVYGSASYPTQNYSTLFNSTNAHNVGRSPTGSNQYFDGYMAEINFIDGQALTPSSFGSFNAITGVWQPARYSGTYGTNGFYLKFNNGTSTTTLGYDTSGNGNNWTTNNISLTAGSTYDWMLDSPTPFIGSSYGVGNYCTLNPLQNGATTTLSSANMIVSDSGTNGTCATSTFFVSSGLWYWEVTLGSAFTYVGMSTLDASRNSGTYLGFLSGQFMYNPAATSSAWIDGVIYNYSTASTATANDVIGVAVNFTANTVVFYKNGVSMGTFGSSFLAGRAWTPAFKSNVTSTTAYFNFGQRPFSYTPPTGYKSLCTQNLPAPAIANGAKHMAATLWTGTNANQSISNSVNSVSFQPDFVWVKSRSGAFDHALLDSIRGVTKGLASNSTAAETTSLSGYDLTAFNANGFTLGPANIVYVNNNGYTYVGWQWKAGGTAVSNTSGTITSSVSANTTAGFSVVTYTGTGANATVGHGLGVAPSMVVFKVRSTTNSWLVYHVSVGATAYLLLDSTATPTTSALAFNNTAPTSSVFTISTGNAVNQSAQTYVAYCFAAIAGYSAFGSYTGNGSTDGPFIYCGFRPRYVLTKRTAATGNWQISDTSRTPSNVVGQFLQANLSSADATATEYDILSNGFKLRSTDGDFNASGETFIFAAFAENPFQNSLAR